MTTAFTTIPAWTLPEAPHATSLWEVIELAGLTGQWVRVSAADQRAILGHAVFGKQQFRVLENGEVEVSRSTCFGMDSEMHAYQPARVKAAAQAAKRLSPGVFGPDYM